MTEQNDNPSDTSTEAESRKPEFEISLVRDSHTGSQWARFGVGWSHKDGEGMNFSNDLLKMFGFRIVARKIKSTA